MEYYVRMAIDTDMIGIAVTNALPTMARLPAAARRVFVPGETEAELERCQLAEAISLNEATIAGIRNVAVVLGVDAAMKQ
jgi:LDH2 family malate/lactate/ureidoglycolate dehydrogenase